MGVLDRFKNGWNAFTNKDPTVNQVTSISTGGYSYRPDRMRFTRGNERTVVTAVYNRIAIDCAAISMQHVKLDDNGRFVEAIDSGLNYCLTVSANVDQAGRAFRQDLVQSLLDEGCIAIIPVDTNIDPNDTESYSIRSLRVGKIVEWYPDKVRVQAYNEKKGIKEERVFSKNYVAIVENPLYAVMNEPNSIGQRLVRKLSLLDAIDEQSGAGKLDLIIQLPYSTKSESRRLQAERRRQAIAEQLADSQYGIAYADSTEKIVQLNRSVENNLMTQIEWLTTQLYAQLGITTEIMNGTADEKTFNNYYSRTIEPILSAITDEMKRKFLTQTARTQKQSIEFFRSPFTLVPASDLAELADKFTRNEIMTSNEFRQIVGLKPAEDPGADELRNKNINQSDAQFATQVDENGNAVLPEEQAVDPANLSGQELVDYYKQQLDAIDASDKELDELEKQLGG